MGSKRGRGAASIEEWELRLGQPPGAPGLRGGPAPACSEVASATRGALAGSHFLLLPDVVSGFLSKCDVGHCSWSTVTAELFANILPHFPIIPITQ